MIDPTTTIVWRSNVRQDLESYPQLVFGELLKLATPHVKHYLSDFYHDAVWLHTNMRGDTFTFHYGYDDCGTFIGDTGGEYNSRQNRCVVTVAWDEYRLTVTVEPY